MTMLSTGQVVINVTALQDARIKRMLALSELALLAHLSPNYLSQIERGFVPSVARDTAMQLALALGVSLEEITS